MLFAELAATSAAVTATAKRLEKIVLLSATLRGLSPDEVVAGVAYLSGEVRQRQTGVGWASLRGLPPPADSATITVAEADLALDEIGASSGPGSQAARRDRLEHLFRSATAPEQTFLRGLLTGELRQGAAAGVMTDAIAKAASVPVAAVRRAMLLRGDLREVAALALFGDLSGLGLEVGRPLSPMLAATAGDLDAALDVACPAGVEWKLDGIRIQVHRSGPDVSIFTRSLDDITARLPEVVDLVQSLPVSTVVLDGEAIALAADGRPLPFQVTASRIGSRVARADVPVTPVFFDALHVDGVDLLDSPAAERFAALASVVPAEFLVRRTEVSSVEEASRAYAEALAAGHEGVVVKALDSPYAAGRRGAGWVKVKPRHTLDLVVLAVERGHGRRSGWLSNLHLGARSDDGFVMLGKTFKGLTDALLAWQTERLRELAIDDDGWVVTVRPELVVEVAFDGVQASRRYPGGVALRFARVVRYREDKTAAEADTIETVRAIHAGGPPPPAEKST